MSQNVKLLDNNVCCCLVSFTTPTVLCEFNTFFFFLLQRSLEMAQSLEETLTSPRSTLPVGGYNMPWRIKFIASSVKAGS